MTQITKPMVVEETLLFWKEERRNPKAIIDWPKRKNKKKTVAKSLCIQLSIKKIEKE